MVKSTRIDGFKAPIWSMPMFKVPLLCILSLSWLLSTCSAADVACPIDQTQPRERWPVDTSEEPSPGPTEWMSQMRERGIKVVGVEAAFVWNAGVEKVSITDHRYYSSFSWGASKLLESPPSSPALERLLEDAARPIMARQLQKLVPERLARSRVTRARGTILIFLYDNPCHPVMARVGELTDSDVPPLITAVSSGDLGRVSALLQNGVDVNVHGQTGFTGLMAASFAGNVEMAKLLIEHGAKVNDQDFEGRTSLHYAVERADASDVIPELLKSRAGMNVKIGARARRFAGATPLIVAAAMGNARAVRILLDAGADRNALTADGMTALDVARHPPILAQSGHSEVIELLEHATRQEAISNAK
jgi:uncharacterized protein